MKQDVSPCAPDHPLGALIAGEGDLPLLLAVHASRSGFPLVAYCLGDRSAYARLHGVEAVSLLSSGREGSRRSGIDLRATIQDMLRRGVRALTLAGTVPKKLMYEASLDPSLRALLEKGSNDDHGLLARIVAAFESAGLRVLPYTVLLAENLARGGSVAGRGPSEGELSDIECGRGILSVTLPLSFGQSVVVARGAVVAIEAMEGTDAMIRRAGELLGAGRAEVDSGVRPAAVGGGVVVKMMRADQDERYDVPVVGVPTLEAMRSAGLTCLAVEAGRTLLLDPEAFRKRADMLGIAVYGIAGGAAPLTGGRRS